MIDTDFMPLSDRASADRHLDILEGLKLDLKIAADGYPEFRGMSARDICYTLCDIRQKKGRSISEIYNAASAVFCHELYFRPILPSSTYPSLPKDRAAEMLSESFGSVGNFFYLVRTLARGTADPGFLWLYQKRRHGKTVLCLARLPLCTLPDLRIVSPLLCIDLWEHAYIGTWGRDISGFADAYLRQTNWNIIFPTTPKIAPSHPGNPV